MCQHSKRHVCSGHVPVLLFAAHCICFRADVLIIPEPARVAALLTHARAEKTQAAELNFTSPGAYAQTRRWPGPTPAQPKHIARPPEDSHGQASVRGRPLESVN